MVSKVKQCWTFEVIGPSMIYNRFNREISCHRITASPCHQTSQSFALPPATKPVSHLPCPLPPNQSVIWLTLYHCVTVSPCHHITMLPCQCTTASLHYRITTSPHHHITVSLPQIFPTTWVWIWLVNANQYSSDWLIVPTTANQITGIEKPNYHKTLIFFPTTSLKWSHEARIDELADSIYLIGEILQMVMTIWKI